MIIIAHIYIRLQSLPFTSIYPNNKTMKRAITEEEANLRFSKMIVAHLISSVHRFEQFQDVAVEMLAQLLINIIKSLAEKVVQLLRLQKRTLPNSLHLLIISENLKLFERENVYNHIVASRQRTQCFEKSQLLSQYGSVLFASLQKTNCYKKDPYNANISFIPPSCTFDFSKALPHRKETYKFFKVIQPKDNKCRLKAYQMLRPTVIEIGEEEPDLVQVYQKDRVRYMYAARNKVHKKFANSHRNEGKWRSETFIPSYRTAEINLDSMENLPKSIIDLDEQISNNLTRTLIVLDPYQ